MGKILKPILQIAAFALNFIPGIGQIASLAITAGLTLAASAIKTGSSSSKAAVTAFDPQVINPDTSTPRKIVFGRTAFPVDLRYSEPSGTNQEYIDYVFALAAHKSDGIESIYIEDDLAWTLAGGVQGKFVGYLTIEIILEAGASSYHTVNGGARWGASQRMTGCTTMRVRVKRSDNSSSSQSPFASGLAGRWVVIGRGIPVYDPARDSTVPGGSGPQRANDQSTWAYSVGGVPRGNNLALQLLTHLIGWKIGGVGSVGCGMALDAIDMASFAVGAARCDESIALAGGGSQRRFEGGRAFTDADGPLGVHKILLDAMNGELIDDGGRMSLRIAVNDLTPVLTLTDDDFMSGYSWRPQRAAEQQYTVVRGQYTQPDAPALFGLSDYPDVDIPRPSLVPRPLSLELSAVQDQRRAERIAKQAAQRSLYQGEFRVTLGIRGWLLRRNDVVAIDSNVRGWTAKLFRVRELGFNGGGEVEATFREENAAIYAWDADESASVTPVAPVIFDSRKAASWLMADIESGATRNEDGAGNAIPTADTLAGATFGGGANLQIISGRAFAGVLGSVGATVVFSDFLPVRGGERRYFEITAYTDVSTPDFIEPGYNWIDASGNVFAENLGDMAFLGTEAVGSAAAKTKGQWATMPADAVGYRLYVRRGAWTESGTFLVSKPYAGRAQPGSDVTGQNTSANSNALGGASALSVLTAINAANLAAADARAVADGKIDTFLQGTTPSGGTIGDLWINTANANRIYRHNGSTFVLADDQRIGAALVAAAGAQATADGKVTTFYVSAAPVGQQFGDLWAIPDEGRIRRWNGANWEVYIEFIANARTEFALSTPTSGTLVSLGTATLGIGPNGTAQVSAEISYGPTGTAALTSGAVELAVFWRPVPGTGSWTQIGASQVGSTASRADDIATGEPGPVTFGSVAIVRTLAGPGALANTEFMVMGRITGSPMTGSGNAVVSWNPA